MTDEISKYFEKVYAKATFGVVAGQHPDFKTRNEVDRWLFDTEEQLARMEKYIRENKQVYCTNCVSFRLCDDELPYCMYENKCMITDCEDSRPFIERPYYEKG